MSALIALNVHIAVVDRALDLRAGAAMVAFFEKGVQTDAVLSRTDTVSNEILVFGQVVSNIHF